MQVIAKTAPNKNTTKKSPNTLSPTKAAEIDASLKYKPNKSDGLTRLLAAYCDCV